MTIERFVKVNYYNIVSDFKILVKNIVLNKKESLFKKKKKLLKI